MHRIDEKITDEAAQCIRENGPDLSWVYLEYTDDMGHMFGDSPQFDKAVGYADEQVGRIWKAIQYRGQNFSEDWLIIITTDHGRDAETGRGHGGQSDRERAGWIVTNAKDLNEVFKKQQSSVVDIMPTITRFMGINIPKDAAWEIDGVPLTGKLSVVQPSADYKNDQAIIRWKTMDEKGKLKIWVSATNNFKIGRKDEYRLMKEIPSKSEEANIDLRDVPSGFYKIILEGKNNAVNYWIMRD